MVPAAVLSCGTVDDSDLVLCAALLRGGERVDNLWLERLCLILEARPQRLRA